jgi:hypothetical protein
MKSIRASLLLAIPLLCALASCAEPGSSDGTTDSGSSDAGTTDGGEHDGGAVDAGEQDAGMTDAGIGVCTKRWSFQTQGGASGVVESGALVLSAPAAANGGAFAIQGGLTGDASVTLRVESFQADPPSSSLPGFSATLAAQSTQTVNAALFSSGMFAQYSPGGGGDTVLDQKSVAATSAVIQLERHGSTGTVTITAGGQSATESGELGTEALFLTLAVAGPTTGSPTSARVTAVEVTGNTGTFQADTFDCDSLIR